VRWQQQAIFQAPKAAPHHRGQPPRQFDHTSILASAKSFFGLGGFLTERDAWAGTFDELLLVSENGLFEPFYA
jgi:hypothetical protein